MALSHSEAETSICIRNVYVGTETNDGRSGALYRIDVDGSFTRVADGFGEPNGKGFTPDLTRMYFTDTGARAIYLFDYDRTAGELSNRRVTFPVGKTSCPAFAGEDLCWMYVTTAGGDNRDQDGPQAGSLFRVDPGVRGVPEFYSRMCE